MHHLPAHRHCDRDLNLNPEFKPRTLRLVEVLWDFLPLTGGFLFILLLLNLNPVVWPPAEGVAAVLTPFSIAFSIVIPISNAVWMQISGHAILRRITLPEWRESLWLSGIEPRPYLLSQLRSRAILQCVPFGVGAAFCVSAAGFGIILVREEPSPDVSLFFGAALIYSLLSLQFCALCAGHLGHLDRLRSLCRPGASELALYFISLKWMTILVLTPPVNGLLGAIAGELASRTADILRGSPALSQNARLLTWAVYCFVMCTLLDLFFFRRLRASWRLAQEEFYRFE